MQEPSNFIEYIEWYKKYLKNKIFSDLFKVESRLSLDIPDWSSAAQKTLALEIKRYA